ncbi:50S ribosomal protein L7 serine acetyltransferase [Vallitalea longa]|uniref:50S ribosomal protein L7 serine acetyltransferase n=1 Tax=Vallitalea longa TaxID=2936439 RepID=A0A9W5YDJ8_9FIRM|nr:GNAT family protein [Vallitalea longa]GKX31079.1 50S ribosomal protein L7 serine acetyltransferase [Vallitalea longa]
MFKHIIDDKLELKLLNVKDAEELHSLIEDNREYLLKWLPWVYINKSIEDTKDFVLSSMKQYGENKGYSAAICYDDKIVGVIGLQCLNLQHKHVSIGYWLAEDYQGKGIMTKCCTALINDAFNNYELERVEIRCAEKNYKSRAIPERLGFIKEGIIRNIECLNEKYVSHVVYGMLREEWK